MSGSEQCSGVDKDLLPCPCTVNPFNHETWLKCIDEEWLRYIETKWGMSRTMALLGANGTKTEWRAWLKKVFKSQPQATYEKSKPDTVPVPIDGGKCGNYGVDYACLMDDRRTFKFGRHCYFCYYSVASPIVNGYIKTLFSESGQQQMVCKITFDVNVKLVTTKRFYVTPGKIDLGSVSEQERGVLRDRYRSIIEEDASSGKIYFRVDSDYSKKAFLHEQGHYEIAAYCFPSTMKIPVTVERSFSGNDAVDIKNKAMAWASGEVEKVVERIKERTERLFEQINEIYYHGICRIDGNPWNGGLE
jgi:hypothetical protein